MNKELIQKLIKQSYFYDEPNDSTIFDREKFAELIVLECAQYIVDKFDYCGDEIIIAEKLKEHFGVTEDD